jgi:tetratricopeptide (TPR) repeat protein
MRARAVWSRLRYFTPQKRITAAREVRALRMPEVARIVLNEADEATRNEPRLAEEWARFAIQLLDIIPERLLRAEERLELLGQTYTCLGNALRVGGDFQEAATVIEKAHGLLDSNWNGSLAQLLSIHASLEYDMGDIAGAVGLLNRGQAIYLELRDRHGIARLEIQHANYLVDTRPTEARAIAEEALLLLPRTELRLEVIARCIISECLAEEDDGQAALAKLTATRPLIKQFREVWVEGRVQLLEARILESLGWIADAERLYTEVARLYWLRELYRESFLVRLRLVEFLVGRDRAKDAAEVCRVSAKLLAETDAHVQMKEVWQELFEALEAKALHANALPNLRDYMVRHWRVPAEQPPAIAA